MDLLERPVTVKSSSKRRRGGLGLPAGDRDVITQEKQKRPATSSSVQSTTIPSVESAGRPSAPSTSSTLPYGGASKRQKVEHKTEGPRHGRLLMDGVAGSASQTELLNMVAKAQADVARMKEEMAEKNKLCNQIELRVKQDMMLDLMRERERTTKFEFALEKERRHARAMADAHHKQLLDSESSITFERNRFLAASAEAKSWRTEVEHYQNLTVGLESDMEELRKLNDEDRAKQHHLNTGLPPPFGSIDDPDRLPPWDRHKDSGPLFLSTAKRRLRVQLDRAAASSLAKSVEIARHYGSGVGSSMASVEVMQSMTQALHRTAQTLKKLLHYADEVRVVRANGKTSRTVEYLDSHVAANQIVEILLDALWRTASIADIRPATPKFSLRDKAEMGTIFSSADDVLLTGFQAAFVGKRELHDLQRRLTQVTALRTEFFKWRLDLQSLFFGNSHMWLSEQVEKEREMAASARVDWTRLAREDKEGEGGVWEGLSSVWDGSEKGSARSSVEPDGLQIGDDYMVIADAQFDLSDARIAGLA